MTSRSPNWRISWIKSTINSTTKTQWRWAMLIINIHRPTKSEECTSARWSSRTTTTWEPCFQYLDIIVLKDRPNWMLLLSDLWRCLEKF